MAWQVNQGPDGPYTTWINPAGQAPKPDAMDFGQWRTGEHGKSYAQTVGGDPSYDQWLAGFKGYLSDPGINKQTGVDYVLRPGSREDIWNRLVFGEEKSQQKNAELDKQIRSVYDQMLLDSGKPSQASLSDINRAESSGKATTYQSLASRGLGNTTLVDSYQNRVGEGAQRERTRVYEDASKQKLGVQGAYANYLNTISNNGPDQSIYANLLTGSASQRKGTDYLSTFGPAAIGAAGLVGAALV